MALLDPLFDFTGDALEDLLLGLLYHRVVPVILALMALGAIFFAPMRISFRILTAAILAVAALYLWGSFDGWLT